IIVFLITILLAVPISLGFGVLKGYTIGDHTPFYYIDFITTNIGLPFGALLICLFVGWVIKPDFVINEIKKSSKFILEPIYRISIKYIAPCMVLIILIWGLIIQQKIIGIYYLCIKCTNNMNTEHYRYNIYIQTEYIKNKLIIWENGDYSQVKLDLY
ncbi:MAG TPA: hypothetical protein O0X99_02745, partial [Methanocorpusculum sp.]|nr:hypothetical protein [Methanocorpusculum sp.]